MLNFLLGLAIALYFILSSSSHFTTPPQSHRTWRLLSLPFFFLASLMWYKGFRGFCPILFLRSSRQLRPWELERLTDDNEAQAFFIQLSEQHNANSSYPDSQLRSPDTHSQFTKAGGDGHEAPLTPISPVDSQSDKAKARIAPFLECSSADFDIFPCTGPELKSASVPSSHRQINPRLAPLVSSRARRDTERCAASLMSSVDHGSFHRPPVFGPARVVEDERIRKVHLHLWWSLVRFGLICTSVLGSIIVAVPGRPVDSLTSF